MTTSKSKRARTVADAQVNLVKSEAGMPRLGSQLTKCIYKHGAIG